MIAGDYEKLSCLGEDGVIRIIMDDGKVNAVSLGLIDELHRAFDDDETRRGIMVPQGRDEMFSAGFDLKYLASSPSSSRNTCSVCSPSSDMGRSKASRLERTACLWIKLFPRCHGK